MPVVCFTSVAQIFIADVEFMHTENVVYTPICDKRWWRKVLKLKILIWCLHTYYSSEPITDYKVYFNICTVAFLLSVSHAFFVAMIIVIHLLFGSLVCLALSLWPTLLLSVSLTRRNLQWFTALRHNRFSCCFLSRRKYYTMMLNGVNKFCTTNNKFSMTVFAQGKWTNW